MVQPSNPSPRSIEIDDPSSGRRTCHNCLAPIEMVRTIMDPATGRNVQMFECGDCGQRTWDD